MAEHVVLVHVHIPRSGGTSVANWLAHAAMRGLTSGHAKIYPGHLIRSEEDLAREGFTDPRVMTASTHDIRSFPARLCGRRVAYFTVVREPMAQFGSLVRYTLENPQRFRVPRKVTTQREVALWLLDARFGELGLENMQTNHLALDTWCRLTDRTCDPDEYARWSDEEYQDYWAHRLGVAEEVLRSFLCVGVLERLPESIQLLRSRSAEIGINLLPAADVLALNATARDDGDLAWLAEDDPLAAQIRAALAVDVQLYAIANALLDAQLQTAGADLRP